MVAMGSHVHHQQYGDGTVLMVIGSFVLCDFPGVRFESSRTVPLSDLTEN
jgi:hypothetical protein